MSHHSFRSVRRSREGLSRVARWVLPLLAIGGAMSTGCAAAPAARTPFPDARAARFAAALAETQSAQHSVGALVAVEDAEHHYAGAVGLADLSTGRPMTVETPYRTASLGKTFTGALILGLQDEGRLSVDDPLSRFMPSFPNASTITLRMLLTHTSGIANYTHIDAYIQGRAATPRRSFTESELIALAAAEPLDFEPGTGWNYSNTGYLILGSIAEQLTGRPLASELESRYFAPLGMTSTRPGSDPPDDLARGYLLDGASHATEAPYDPGYPADGGWITTLHDQLVWARELFGGHLHSASTLAIARHPEGGAVLDGIAQSYGFETGGYALGFVEAHDAQLGELYAGAGNGDGMRTFVGYFPDRDLAFAVFVDVGLGTVPLVETLGATAPTIEAVRADALDSP